MGLPGISTGLALLLFVVDARRPLPDLYENIESFSKSFSICNQWEMHVVWLTSLYYISYHLALIGQAFAGYRTTGGALGYRLGDWGYCWWTARTRKTLRTHLRLYVLANATKAANIACRKDSYSLKLQCISYISSRNSLPDNSVNVRAKSISAISPCLQMALMSTWVRTDNNDPFILLLPIRF